MGPAPAQVAGERLAHLGLCLLYTSPSPRDRQRAFVDEQAVQCGYCISGMIMAAKELLDQKPRPNETEVREALAGNLCRCGTHGRIIRAVMRASDTMGRT